MAPVQKLTALIVDPDSERSNLLRSAARAISDFGRIEHVHPSRAARQMTVGEPIGVIFLSSAIAKSEADKIISDVKTAERSSDSAIVMTILPENQDAKFVSDGLLRGIDGFLFEPFSIEKLHETTRIAKTIYTNRRRARELKAVELLTKDLTRCLDDVAERLAVGKDFGRELKGLRTIAGHVRDLDGPLLIAYFETLERVCAEADPAPARTIQPSKAERRIEERLRRLVSTRTQSGH